MLVCKFFFPSHYVNKMREIHMYVDGVQPSWCQKMRFCARSVLPSRFRLRDLMFFFFFLGNDDYHRVVYMTGMI